MRQRLGIAQAILNKPKLLILDEPTNGLDPEGIKNLRDLLKKLAKEEKMAIFISSHNLSELESFCNKVCIIKNGSVIETNDINYIKNDEEDSSYVFNVSDISFFDGYNCQKISEHEIKVFVSREEVPHIIKKLVDNGIFVYEVKKESLSLEEAFLKKAGGNKID
jgi:ABC-2 type transport system ATP-binding protein